MNTHWAPLGLLAMSAYLGIASVASATPIDTLHAVTSTYSVYASGNMGGPANGQAYSSSSQGRIAVGGDLYLQGFQANGNVVVGGKLKLNNGQIAGTATTGGPAVIQNGTVAGGVSDHATANPLPGQGFAQVSSDLSQASALLGDLAANGTTYRNPWGQISFTGTDADLNVFSVTTDLLAGINNLQVAAPDGSTVLINVIGDSYAGQNYGFSLTGVGAGDILFNFETASALNFSGLGWQGAILAPQATVTAVNGQFNGAVVANNLTGITWQNANFNNVPFGGDFSSAFPAPTLPQLPVVIDEPSGDVAEVPVPGSLPLFAAGLVALAGFAWRRRPA